MADAHDLLEKVVDKQSFLVFVKALIADKIHDDAQSLDQSCTRQSWQHESIEDFLGAAVAWAECSNFGISQKPEIANNLWYQFAVFLYCGKIYE